MFKYLEPLKGSKHDDKNLSLLIEKAYDYYQNRTTDSFTESDYEDAYLLSSIVRFFKCINSGKKIDEEFLQNYLKNEIFLQKPNCIKLIGGHINQIKEIQAKRVLFSSPEIQRNLKNVPLKSNSKGVNIRQIVNVDYQIDVVISNNYSNRVLLPEIILIFTLDDGSNLKVKIDIRMFNELRKNLALNVKKILENENVNLLK